MERTLRDRISMARMVCVLFMILVHVPGALTSVALQGASLPLFLQGFLVEGPGRASASLLSLLSGYLTARVLLRPGRQLPALYARRLQTLVLPMLFWGCLTWLLYSLISRYVGSTFIDDANGLLDHLNIILFLTHMPDGATLHLGFLRDLFVCILLSPVLLFALRRVPLLLLCSLAILYVVVHDQSAVLILRPLILLAFTFGLWLALRGTDLRVLDRYRPLWLIAATASALLVMASNGNAFGDMNELFARRGLDFREAVLYPLTRLFGSLAIWTTLPLFQDSAGFRLLNRGMPYLFATYCSHFLVLTLAYWGLWMPLMGAEAHGFFTLWFLAAPLLSLGSAIIMVEAIGKVTPGLASLMTGGRVDPRTTPFERQVKRAAVSTFFSRLTFRHAKEAKQVSAATGAAGKPTLVMSSQAKPPVRH